jgi:methylated-DNA-[protein]-cysteine S-methyltransferase
VIGFAIFDTALGPCGIAWQGDAIVGTALPAADRGSLLRQLERRFPQAQERDPPGSVRSVTAMVARLLDGDAPDFPQVKLALGEASPFERQVYAETQAIPCGETRTYGELAAAVGTPGAARAVGRALGRNPIPIIIPCHRIVAANGRSGGFSAPGGVSTKMRLLQIERARRGHQPTLFDDPGWRIAPGR